MELSSVKCSLFPLLLGSACFFFPPACERSKYNTRICVKTICQLRWLIHIMPLNRVYCYSRQRTAHDDSTRNSNSVDECSTAPALASAELEIRELIIARVPSRSVAGIRKIRNNRARDRLSGIEPDRFHCCCCIGGIFPVNRRRLIVINQIITHFRFCSARNSGNARLINQRPFTFSLSIL